MANKKKQDEFLEMNNTGEMPETNAPESSEPQYSLNDDRRVKVLSPGAMVAKRFIRNRIAMVGLVILIAMFVFSFVGGLISPYKEDQSFYRTEILKKEYASAIQNQEFRYLSAEGQKFTSEMQAYFLLEQMKGNTEFKMKEKGVEKTYTITKEGDNFYSVQLDGTMIGIAYKDIFSVSDSGVTLSFETMFAGLKAYSNNQPSFTAEDVTYQIAEDGVIFVGETEFGYISDYVVQALLPDVFDQRF